MTNRTNRGGFDHRGEPNYKRLFLIGGAILVVLLAWVLLVTSIGGARSEERDQPGNSSHQQARQDGRSGAASKTGAPDAPTENEGTLQMSGTDGPHYITPENPQKAIKQKYGEGPPEGGAVDEPAAPDPLGINPKPGELSTRDSERAELAASKFVTAAYGFTGDDENEYNQGVGATVVWPEFYDSPGASEIKKYASQVEDGGTESAAKLVRLQKENVSGDYGEETIEAIAYFDTADTYNRYGEIEGARKSYRQQLTLDRDGAVFAVRAAGDIQQIQEEG